MNANEAMKIADKLYASGYTSCPRTEANVFPEDFNFATLIEKHTVDKNWGGKLITNLLSNPFYFLHEKQKLEFATSLLKSGVTPQCGTKMDLGLIKIKTLRDKTNISSGATKIIVALLV